MAANLSTGNVWLLLGDGQGGFGAAVNYSVGSFPRAVVTGDFNRDGKSDLAEVNAGAHDAAVLLGDGAAGFASPSQFSAGVLPEAITAPNLTAMANLTS